jgi:hypothetical protein
VVELPVALPPDAIAALDPGTTLVWASGRGAAWLRETGVVLPIGSPGDPVAPSTTTMVVIGGGSFIDEAKVLLAPVRSRVRVIAVPTIWGSGAEASPIAVVGRSGAKEIHVDPSLLPDALIHDERFARTVPPERARHACGDVWAHAIEGFASPLAKSELRAEIADLVNEMLDVPLGPDPRWFALGAHACAAQARSGVGLVHGMAHVLEVALADPAWGHARLCAALLAPVLAFDITSEKWARLFAEHGVDLTAVEGVSRRLAETDAWATVLLPAIRASWPRIIRDPLTRTNATVVRPGSLAFFEEYGR